MALKSLKELSSEAEQRRLWLNEDNNEKEQSSFTEALEYMFTDSGLRTNINKGTTGLSSLTLLKIEGLSKVTRSLLAVEDAGIKKLFEDPRLVKVRELAASLYIDIARERDEFRERH